MSSLCDVNLRRKDIPQAAWLPNIFGFLYDFSFWLGLLLEVLCLVALLTEASGVKYSVGVLAFVGLRTFAEVPIALGAHAFCVVLLVLMRAVGVCPTLRNWGRLVFRWSS